MIETFQPFTLEQVVRTGMAILVLISGIISVIFIIWGGFLMILSAGNEEKVKAAVNHIRHAFLGVLLIIAVLYVFPTFLDLIGVPYGDYMRPRAVFENIGWLSDKIFGGEVATDTMFEPPTNNTLPSDFTEF